MVLTAFDQCHDAMYRNGQLAKDYADDVGIPASTDPPWRAPLRPRAGGGWEYVVPGESEPSAGQIEADTDVAAVVEFGGHATRPAKEPLLRR